jgi:hypothetical protein
MQSFASISNHYKNQKSSSSNHVREKQFFKPIIQTKLAINEPNDVYEQEANAVADKVMRITEPSAKNFFSPTDVQKRCAHCEEEGKKMQRKESNNNAAQATKQTENYINSLPAGKTLGMGEKSFFESRMGYDFSNVQVHDDSSANQSAENINALAYTHGNKIVFGSRQYQPGTDEGKKLMAHELTHVIQQTSSAQNSIQRFSDTDHHILEEVGLAGVFSEEDLKSVERGNMRRDYSQLSDAAAYSLTGESKLGGYKKHEHFDNFIFDREKDRWVSHDEYENTWDDHAKEWVAKTIVPRGTRTPKITPLQYIEAELIKAVEKDMPDSGSFMHAGNAFHTIEDFFAHSNFVELAKGDYSFGKELTTHLAGVPGASSEDSIKSNVFDPVPASAAAEKFKIGYEKGSTLSHGRLAKDFHINPNHSFAITLAALVIRQTALMLKKVFGLKTKEKRNESVRSVIMATLNGYLRPPDEKNKWWEKLVDEDTASTGRKIKELQAKTPVTVNQDPGSPLHNIEATRNSPWKGIGLGTSFSFPLKDTTFLTTGFMFNLPGTGALPDERLLAAPRAERDQDKSSIVLGIQVSGNFDENNFFKR